MKRAERRHHKERMKKRALSKLRNWHWNDTEFFKFADNLTRCSCHMCCNERRNPWLPGREKMTIQERRAQDNFEDSLENFGDDDESLFRE